MIRTLLIAVVLCAAAFAAGWVLAGRDADPDSEEDR
jgi:hypothetical protein